MRKIFISYRRDDAEEAAGRLSDHLVTQFGRDNIFMDVDGIDPGRDFRKVIDETLTQCDVLLGVVGRNWLDTKDETGKRRLEDDSDFVRLEIAAALRRDIPVIPVRVQGATIPKPAQLPDDLKDFAYRNAVELTHERWSSDVQVLVEKLRRLMTDPGSCAPPPGIASAATPPPLIDQPERVASAVPRAVLRPTPRKGLVKKIIKWSLVGFLFLVLFIAFGNGGFLFGSFVTLIAAVLVWDPYHWFGNKVG
ncbi:MAG TPA: toll/interleukin-1 receptor domain-containing protein [Terriglobales bacterium]